jgi:beta-glucosidase
MTGLRCLRRAIVLALGVSALAAGGAQAASPDRRAADLVAAMTLDEKIQLVHGIAVCQFTPGNFPGSERTLKGAGFIPGIPRLGIPDINYTDAGAGVTNCGKRPNGQSTMLPSPLARASSWNPAATYDAGALIGREARVQGFTGLLGGVSELIREPRWGRSFETLGEDPVLNGTLVASELRGVQDQKVVATIKHYAANNQETGRQQHSVEIDERTLRELHLLPYEIAVPASKVGSVMCSYNKVNGTYACENDYLINQVLKGDLGFKGQVQSDWGATHSTVASALAGLDEEEFRSQYFGQALKTAVEAGEVPQSRLDDMVRRKLRSLIAIGVLDDPPGPPGSIDVSYGAAVTERIARQSSVLLKNAHRTLPLSRRADSIAVIGSHADVGVLSGGGSSQVTPPGGPAIPPACDPEGPGGSHCPVWAPSSPLEAIKAEAPGADVRFADGTDATAAAALAKSADVAVVFANEWRQEGEDRQDMNLPDGQEGLIRQVAAANRNTVVVLENGGPLVLPWIGDVRAVLEAWYPGSRGGSAIADVLFGDFNPSGKLTVTFPREAADTPTGAAPPTTALSIPYSEQLLVGYRWYDAKGIAPLFEFGHGLSYTSYRYSRLTSTASHHGLKVSFEVANTGSRSGAEVAQVYAGLPAAAGEPPKRLVGWARVALRPGERRRVSVDVDTQRLSIWKDGWKLVPGDYKLAIGASSRDIRLRAEVRLR